jgi:hypothetical protein
LAYGDAGASDLELAEGIGGDLGDLIDQELVVGVIGPDELGEGGGAAFEVGSLDSGAGEGTAYEGDGTVGGGARCSGGEDLVLLSEEGLGSTGRGAGVSVSEGAGSGAGVDSLGVFDGGEVEGAVGGIAARSKDRGGVVEVAGLLSGPGGGVSS